MEDHNVTRIRLDGFNESEMESIKKLPFPCKIADLHGEGSPVETLQKFAHEWSWSEELVIRNLSIHSFPEHTFWVMGGKGFDLEQIGGPLVQNAIAATLSGGDSDLHNYLLLDSRHLVVIGFNLTSLQQLIDCVRGCIAQEPISQRNEVAVKGFFNTDLPQSLRQRYRVSRFDPNVDEPAMSTLLLEYPYPVDADRGVTRNNHFRLNQERIKRSIEGLPAGQILRVGLLQDVMDEYSDFTLYSMYVLCPHWQEAGVWLCQTKALRKMVGHYQQLIQCQEKPVDWDVLVDLTTPTFLCRDINTLREIEQRLNILFSNLSTSEK